MRRRGFTLVEVAVAVMVLATAGTALQRLVATSVRTMGDDAVRARTLVAARAALAEATLRPPPLGHTVRADGDVTITRDVESTAHPWLRSVRVVAEAAAGRDRSELVELVYAPAG